VTITIFTSYCHVITYCGGGGGLLPI